MRGWFDAFRDDGAPTLYSFSNRTPVIGDVPIIASTVLFATFYLAFLVIFPGVRKQKFSTFVTVTLSLFVGLVILVGKFGSSWHVAQQEIVAPYKAFSREKLPARIGAHIGLMHVNVTLTGLPVGNWSAPDIDFNERFYWNQAHDMENSYKYALKRGLPYPILTIAEYFSLGQEGFAWGGQYRAAGYFASILLWASLASWFLMNLLLTAVPRYGAYGMCVTGFLLDCSAIGYYLLLPKPPLVIFIEGAQIAFRLGWCFWLVLVAGSMCLFIGLIVSSIDLIWPHKFSTILEVYYDTPYDRHVILEESHDVRYRKRNSKGLEEPPSLGSRILRRLSSKTREQTLNDIRGMGIENRGFQQEVPKSPWRYPFRRAQVIIQSGLQRTISQDSTSTIASAANISAMSSPAGPSATSSGSVVIGHGGTVNANAVTTANANAQSLRKEALSRMLPPRPPIDRNKHRSATELTNW